MRKWSVKPIRAAPKQCIPQQLIVLAQLSAMKGSQIRHKPGKGPIPRKSCRIGPALCQSARMLTENL